jgi:hypothetical protein
LRNIIFILICVFLLGCKKEIDGNPPIISISSPTVFSNFDVFDFVAVIASVTDETNLEAVTVDIQDASFNNVVPKIAINVTANSVDINQSIHLNDIHLESGVHYLKIWASDGTNEKSEYKQINITGVPLSINNRIIVSSPVAGTQEWDSFDGISTTPYQTFASEYGGAAVNSYHQYLITMGSFTDNLVAYDPIIIDTVWEKINPGNPPSPYYLKMLQSDDGITYVTTSARSVTGYGQSGTITATVNSSGDYKPDDIFVWGDRIYVEQRHDVTASHFMGVYYRSSGATDKSIGFGNDIVSWEIRTANELFVCSNDGAGQGKLEIYNYSTNSFWEPHAIPPGNIYDTYSISPGQLMISHDLGLYKYTYSTNSLIQVESGHSFTKMVYDEVSNVLWCIEGADLYSYDLAGNQLSYFSHTSDIKELLLFYNK